MESSHSGEEGPQRSRPGIFLSYRRSDAAGYAGRLYDSLAARFGGDRVFMDVDALEAGVDFVEALDRAIASSGVLLVVIGPQWLTATDGRGRTRLDSRDDFVRLEVRTALEGGLRVIPVLVGGATMPAAADLPEDLAGLARRHAHELSDTRWRHDVDRLIAALERIVEDPGAEPAGPPTVAPPVERRSRRPRLLVAIVVAVVLIAGVAGGLWVLLGSGGGADYPASVTRSFLASCTQAGSSRAVCQCALDKLEEKYPLEEFTREAARFQRGEAAAEFSEDLVTFGLQCQQEVG